MNKSKKLLAAAFALLLLPVCWRCNPPKKAQLPAFKQAQEVMFQWQKMLLELAQKSEGYRPPVSARMFAYVGLAAWEACLPAFPEAVGFDENLDGLRLEKWKQNGQFHVGASLNAAYSTMANYFFPHAPRTVQQKSRELAEKFRQEFRGIQSQNEVSNAEAFGRAIADSIYHWSASDGVGHEAHYYNFDQNYQPETKPGFWKPSAEHPMPALLPNWACARTFIVPTSQCPGQPPLAFSENKGSEFFAQAMEIYSLSAPMTEEKRWIAEFWSDDTPGISICTASRWISIALQVFQKNGASLPSALETLLKLGFALNDASVKVWQEKYAFNLERPETYIRRNIAPDWEPLHPAPSFPAYPSGHAGFGAAAACILERQFGKSFSMSDRTHEGRKEFMGKPRHFDSFQDMARENALSRLFLGVHFRMDSEEGLRVGTFVGSKIADLQLWNKPSYLSQN